MESKQFHISVGAGFENDRRALGGLAANALTAFQGPRYLIFECLAERTLALNSISNDRDALARRAISFLSPCIATCAQEGIRIVSNFGGPDPAYVASAIREWLAKEGLNLRVCAVTGDALPIAGPDDDPDIIARNAYTGAAGIVAALEKQADIVVVGRVADPTLAVGPAVHELALDWQDLDGLATATLAGHLIECGTQVCGGYFADLSQEVPGLPELGPPVATVSRDAIVLSKPVGGGLLNRATVTQQILYELHDPAAYITPDVVLDVTAVTLTENGNGEIYLTGAKGHPRPETLKTLTCRKIGWFGEAEISYYGATSRTRALLARSVIESDCGDKSTDIRFDLFDGEIDNLQVCRLRVAARSSSDSDVTSVLDSLEALYVNGPAAGGGVRRALSRSIETIPGLIPRDKVSYELHWGSHA